MVVRLRLEALEVIVFCIMNSNGIAMIIECVAGAVSCIIAMFMHMGMNITILLGTKIKLKHFLIIFFIILVDRFEGKT
jgi:hypothetical protein